MTTATLFKIGRRDNHAADLMDGKFPPKQTRLVQAWIELRREELIADWSLAVTGQPVERVEPLR